MVASYTVTVLYSCDDGRSLTIDYKGVITAQQIDNQINNQLDSLNGLQSQDDVLAATVMRVPAVIPEQTPEQIAARDVFVKRQALVQTKEDFDLGLADQAALDAALNDAKAAQATAAQAAQAVSDAKV